MFNWNVSDTSQFDFCWIELLGIELFDYLTVCIYKILINQKQDLALNKKIVDLT